MTPEEISAHLAKYRERQERIANEEKVRMEREEALFRISCERCEGLLRETVEPMLNRLAGLLTEQGHHSILRPTQETEHTTERTKLRSLEYATSIAVERPKGTLILRVVATPQSMQISSLVGVPHGNCSSVFHAGSGPLTEAVEVTNHGISDFMASAFPLR